ncbi:MAG TPA: ATP-binding cassette domain-containing protein [Acidimicrobiia bacterium]|jgi:daunorubicin resistance ABC transporter ATP-binding subunit|nr:ATP-binding cassette domain-containing protein [Acidimicrobiia bacterium]
MIRAEGLRKAYGEQLAVADVSLEVHAGRILGVLGPNGAGKSTTVRMLTTMTRPDAGAAWVAGHDVIADPQSVRRVIGVTGQDATLDELLSGRQNLELVGILSDMPRSAARARAAELLDQFELTFAADRMVKTYSGGMRRRLDLAASLMAHPPVLFLDEPTTGLDPTSRLRMWEVIRTLVADGTTVLLTTQYLDEADTLADTISVIDHGLVIADGTARELKASIGGEHLEVTLEAPDERAAGAFAPLASGAVQVMDGGKRLRAPVVPRHGLVTAVVRALDDAGIAVDDVEMHHPSLDDVFFALTGHAAEEPVGEPDELVEV